MSDDQRDPATGLLNRQAFMDQVREAHHTMPTRLRRGCLLILKFPVLKRVATAAPGLPANDDAMRHLLAIIETRVRSRDTLARISDYSLCLFLRGCRLDDAIIVADQYVALLRDIVVQAGERQLPMDLRYRIVPLDPQTSKPGQGVTRIVVAPPINHQLKLAKQINVAGNSVDLDSSSVVSLNTAWSNELPPADIAPGTGVDDLPVAHGTGESNSAQAWRLRPGILIQRMPLVCCHRLQAVGLVNHNAALQQSDLFASVLNALALRDRETRPIIESQIILPIRAQQIDPQFAIWLSDRCKVLRVAPSDVCLSIGMDSLSKELRRVAPVLRSLNRYGIRLMLEGVESANQYRMMRNVAHFDYLHVSGRSLNDSLAQVSARVALESIVKEARARHSEICSGGIDSPVLMNHALAMHIEIGFGRQLASSTAFPEPAWTQWDAEPS